MKHISITIRVPSFFRRGLQSPHLLIGLFMSVFYLTGISSANSQSSCADFFEPNESPNAATSIAPSSTTNATIGSTSDWDYYKMDLIAGKTLKLDLTNLPADYDIYLYNSGGTEQAHSMEGSTLPESITFNVPVAGTYYIKVLGYNGVFNEGVCYRLNSTYIGSGCNVTTFEPNESINTATQVVPDYTVDGAISILGDEDFYSVSLPAGKILVLNLSGLPADYDLFLYNANGNLVTTSTNSNTASETIMYSGTATGIFYIRVSGYNGAFSATACYLLTFRINTTPSISITSPANNALYSTAVPIDITAYAEDTDGTVSGVSFYRGSTFISTDYTAPYTAAITNLPVGNYSLTAVATDNLGATTTSGIINITVKPITDFGVMGPSCIMPGQTYTYTVVPDSPNSMNSGWWASTGVNINSTSIPRQINLFVPPFLSAQTFTLTAGVGFNGSPYFQEYTKTITIGGCAATRTELNVNPQPFDESTTLSAGGQKIISVIVYDVKGQEVFKAENIMQDSFKLGDSLAAGLYIVVVTSEDGVNTTRMIKSK